MPKIEKLKIFSFAKFQACLGGYVGLLLGILYSFGGLIIDVLVSLGWIVTSETPGLSYGTVLAFGALIAMPVILLVFGFVLGIVEAILFNFFSRWFGGIAVDFEQ